MPPPLDAGGARGGSEFVVRIGRGIVRVDAADEHEACRRMGRVHQRRGGQEFRHALVAQHPRRQHDHWRAITSTCSGGRRSPG
jgi:hypothetical protein